MEYLVLGDCLDIVERHERFFEEGSDVFVLDGNGLADLLADPAVQITEAGRRHLELALAFSPEKKKNPADEDGDLDERSDG